MTETRPHDVAAIKGVLESHYEAWDAADADAFVTDYAEDATVIMPGIYRKSREEVRQGMAEGSEVARVRVRDHRSRIAAHSQGVPEELVHPELLGSGDLDYRVQRRTYRDPGDGLGDIVSGHGLELSPLLADGTTVALTRGDRLRGNP